MKDASRCQECGGQLASTDHEVYCMSCGLIAEEESLVTEVTE